MNENALVILSGGQDSTTCLFWAKQQFANVFALSFDYGQRHRIELDSAATVARMADVRHEVINLGPIFAGLSPLTNAACKLDQYASAAELPGGLEKTFVPGRNILFLTVAANRAYVLGCKNLVIGVSQEDFGGYPDCREDFLEKMSASLTSGLDSRISIYAPLMRMNKAQSVLLAKNLPGCFEALSHTTTCYAGTVPPCAHCHACLLRSRGFEEVGIKDPMLARIDTAVLDQPAYAR
ncbi:MAG TPA: 7-cyano-7-deazaguanine synthase QueC [Oculatellaceae cyanobacterium]